MSTHRLQRAPRLILWAGSLALVIGSMGCGARQSQDEGKTVVYNKEKMNCKREYPTGSHLPVMRCVDRQAEKDRRDADQNSVRDLQNRSAINPNM
ncbi:hypothetical protein Hoch_6740 [Haliangium ochraceum DSM 14365]|uniref:Lipoprotein n=2 Tax=Haliangium ochraceum TaxID=80816 RepID=D0LT68_HALO1|nr:hypothetical protein Hoch_6740 [Haliangium ochraceum DSM 14365]